jgi:hypothetical protein
MEGFFMARLTDALLPAVTTVNGYLSDYVLLFLLVIFVQ